MASVGHSIAGFTAALAVTLAAVGAGTVFNGLTVTATGDAAADSGSPETGPPPTDGGGDAPADAFPAPLNYLTTQQGAELCTLAATCPLLSASIQSSVGVPIDANNFSLCMEWAVGPIPGTRQGFPIQQGVLQCMAQATSCAAAGACNVFEDIAASDPRCATQPNDSGAFCSDSVTKVDCAGLFVQHCGVGQYTPGATCNVGTDQTPWCSLGGLDAGCPANASCISTFQDYCGVNGLHFRLNCANVGDSCDVTDGGVQCGEACTTIAITCSGNTAQSCDGVEESPFDCAALGGTCSSKDNAIYCARPGDTCTPLDSDVNVCTGTTLSLCVGGTKSSFDCATISKQCVPGVVPQTPHCG